MDRLLLMLVAFLFFFGALLTPGCSFILSPRQTRVFGGCYLDQIDDIDSAPWNDGNNEPANINNKKTTPQTPQKQSSEVPNMLNRISKKQQVLKRRQGEAASAAMNLPSQPLVTTLNGGSDLLFRMARQQIFPPSPAAPRWHPSSTSGSIDALSSLSQAKKPAVYQQPVAVPIEARAAATTIWKNARKRNKPSLWRYAIRTMERLPPAQTTNVHYEGTLVAAAKLGWSEKAFSIYATVVERQTNQLRTTTIHLTDNMMLSLVKASVRDALRSKDRAILDKVVLVLRQDDQTTAAHWNPIAAAYRKLSLNDVAREIIASLPVPHDGDRFNVQDVHAKDKGSFAIAVSTSVATGNFGRAVRELKNMTELGLYPETRHLGEWAALSKQ